MYADFPEQVVGLNVTEITTYSIVLVWTFQMNGSEPRIRTEIEIRRNGSLERTDMIAPQFSGAELSSLLPLSLYNFTVYVVSDVGRSRPSVVSASTLSLSNSLFIIVIKYHNELLIFHRTLQSIHA